MLKANQLPHEGRMLYFCRASLNGMPQTGSSGTRDGKPQMAILNISFPILCQLLIDS
jgi:hypothetical protein